MTRDIEIVCAIFGFAAKQPSLLAAELLNDAHAVSTVCVSDAQCAWAERATHLIRAAATGTNAALRQCAASAFDDPDERVRGLAWCMLTELEHRPGMGDIVAAFVAAEFKKRIAPPRNPAEREEEATGFALMVGATVLTATTDQMLKAFECEYIEDHGGDDAWLIKSSAAAAFPFLEHPNRGRRLAAIRVIAREGKGDRTACDAIYYRMIHDIDADVRLAATVAYTDVFKDTCDLHCLRCVATIVLDEEQPMLHRFAAYCGLLKVCGRPFNTESVLGTSDDDGLERLRDGTFGADWPVVIDWDFVQRCARGQEKLQ